VAGVSVLVVDDEYLIRTGLRLLLDGVDGITVVGEAANGAEALEAVATLAPDVVLMDIRMPVMSGLEAIDRLLDRDPACRVLVLTTFDNDQTVLQALQQGAVGFLLKDTAPEDLVDAVRQAARGRIPLSPSVTRQLVGRAAGAVDGRSTQALAALDALTARERDVAVAVARGDTNAEIADTLFVSLATVKTHLGSVMAKLGATNRVQVALRVYEAGLSKPDAGNDPETWARPVRTNTNPRG
jgi:DNA-binding NarL/FixJ family response regulator